MQQWLTDQQAYPSDVIVLVSIITESHGQGGTIIIVIIQAVSDSL